VNAVEIILLLIGGLLAGVINTLAGNGSAITLSLLIFTGLPADAANATNRIGATVQTITALGSLRRTKRTRHMFKESYWYFVPSVLGSVIGAYLATLMEASALKVVIGLVMLALLFTLLYNPKKWLKATDVHKNRKTRLNWILMFFIAIYGGFIQMGIGIMLLSLLVLVADYSLRDANIVKLVLATIFVVPAFFVFLWSGDFVWLPGLVLAAGQGLGGWLGARYILALPKANVYVRWLLVVILSVSSLRLLGLFDLLISWF
jgi:uncharacterized membrane protein YfcA